MAILPLLLRLLAVTLFVCSEAALMPSIHRRAASVHPTTSMLLGRFLRRNKKEVEAPPQIKTGGVIPDVDIEILRPDEPESAESDGFAVAMPLSEAMGNGTSMLVGMPGAFTPTCTTHLPSLLNNWKKIRTSGVDTVCVITTNDRYVNEAWRAAVASNLQDSGLGITMLSDGDGEAVKALGLIDDMGFGVGFRSKRFALIAKEGVVQSVAVDEGMDVCDATSVEAILDTLKPLDATSAFGLDLSNLSDQNKGGLALGAIFIAAALATMGNTDPASVVDVAAAAGGAAVVAKAASVSSATVVKSAAVHTAAVKTVPVAKSVAVKSPAFTKAAAGYQQLK